MKKTSVFCKFTAYLLINYLLFFSGQTALALDKTDLSSTLSPSIALSKSNLKQLFKTKKANVKDIGLIPASKSFNIPLPFPLAEYDRGQRDPEWLKSHILSQVILELSSEYGIKIPLKRFIQGALNKFNDYGFSTNKNEILSLLNGLRKRGLVKTSGDYEFTHNRKMNILVSTPLRTIAVWADAFDFIRADLQKTLKAGRNEFLKAMSEYSASCELWANYPIEAKYPVLRAVSQFSASEQKHIVELLTSNQRIQSLPLADAVILMLDIDKGKQRWLNKNAPQLANRNIYLVAAEISLLAGGLGRVMQYHGNGMHQLGASVIYVEPYYRMQRDKDGKAIPLDYRKAPVPVEDLRKLDQKFTTIVQNQNIEFEVFTGKNKNGIAVYMIQDKIGRYTNILYEYGTFESPASNYEFTEFFTKASLELIRYLEVNDLEKMGENYNAPLVDANDGQVLPLNAFRRIFYSEPSKILKDGTTKDEIEKAYKVFKTAIFNGTTHTYRNRGIIGDFNYGRDFLRNAGVPDEYLWLFLRKESEGNPFWDLTSGGLRSSDIAKGVSAIHAYEMNTRDPLINLVGITNGDNREYSAHYFRKALQELGITDFEHPSPEKVIEAKKMCKHDIGLNPDQLVVSYSGRLVTEKAGRDRAFTDTNIETMVKQGIQVVLYGNVQPYEESIRIRDSLQNLEKRLAESGYPGKFIFNPKFNIDEQRKLLAATDIQIQDSDRYTGAAEYTEADVTACGGLQMGAPFWEGIIQRQGVAINTKTKTGNTLVPESTSSESYLKIIQWANSLDKDELGIYQAQSIKLSRVLESSLTSAAYLRFWNNAFWKKTYNMAAPIPRVSGEISISEIEVDYQTETARSSAKRSGNIFSIDENRNNLENVEIEVTVDRNAHDAIHFGNKGLVPLETIKVTLVNDYGISVPFCIKESNQQKAIFNAFISEDMPLPFNGDIEITSGLWKVSQKIDINTDPTIKIRLLNSNTAVSIEQAI